MLTLLSSNNKPPRQIWASKNWLLSLLNMWRMMRDRSFGPMSFVLALVAMVFTEMPVRADLVMVDSTGPWVGDPDIGG